MLLGRDRFSVSDLGVAFRGVGCWGTLSFWGLTFFGALAEKCDFPSHARTKSEVKGIPSGMYVCQLVSVS